MKKLILFLAVIATPITAFSQDRNPFLPSQNCVMMRDKRVWVVEVMNSPVYLNNGVQVMPDGTVKLKDGKTITLDDGYAISMVDGRLSGTNVKDDKVLMKSNNKVWLLTRVEHTMVLNNKITVLPGGFIKTKEGDFIIMKDGDWIDMNGTVNVASR